jgi:hypothetical protein
MGALGINGLEGQGENLPPRMANETSVADHPRTIPPIPQDYNWYRCNRHGWICLGHPCSYCEKEAR